MKKNISINLFGTLYAIDEDAYNLLESYLDSMKTYFSRQEGGEEIADDIEHRVAEHLWQEKENGAEAVNISMIKDIISKIGDPAQIAGNDTSDASTEDAEPADTSSNTSAESNNASSSDNSTGSSAESNQFQSNSSSFSDFTSGFKGRKLYRDITDKMVAGVCSGLSHYFGGDSTIWRLGTAVLTLVTLGFVGWVVPIIYLVLWAVVPIAVTAEDKLRMRGEPVNPQNLNQQILHDSDPKVQQMYYAKSQSNSGCLKAAGIGCLVLLLIPLILVLLCIIVAVPAFSGVLSSGIFESIPDFHIGGEVTGGILEAMQGMIWGFAGCCIMLLVIPIILIFRLIKGSSKSISTGFVVGAVLLWIASLIFALFLFFHGVGKIGKGAMDYHIETTIMDDDDDYWMDEPDTVAVEEMDTAEVAVIGPEEEVPADTVTRNYSVSSPGGIVNMNVTKKVISGGYRKRRVKK